MWIGRARCCVSRTATARVAHAMTVARCTQTVLQDTHPQPRCPCPRRRWHLQRQRCEPTVDASDTTSMHVDAQARHVLGWVQQVQRSCRTHHPCWRGLERLCCPLSTLLSRRLQTRMHLVVHVGATCGCESAAARITYHDDHHDDDVSQAAPVAATPASAATTTNGPLPRQLATNCATVIFSSSIRPAANQKPSSSLTPVCSAAAAAGNSHRSSCKMAFFSANSSSLPETVTTVSLQPLRVHGMS